VRLAWQNLAMTRRRWFADEVAGNRAVLVGKHADHLTRVLRAQIGQEFDIATGNSVRRGRIAGIGEGRVELELAEEVSTFSPPDITLLLSIFKFDRMEWAIEKCTELGVTRIVPVIAQRTEKHLASAAAKRVERWQRIARQAAEQSRRTSSPEIAHPLKLKDAATLPGNCRIVLSEIEKHQRLVDLLPDDGEIVMAFGPEGGWTGSEIELFHNGGWKPASLGDTILRAETAAIAAMAVAVSRWRA
jgi:16S rRNA (uracil1498-N3)-methyltransferase